ESAPHRSLFHVFVQPLSPNRGNRTVYVMMTTERWQQIKSLFDAVMGQPPAQRADFLARACRNDRELRLQVEAMLRADTRAEQKISPSAPAAKVHLTAHPPALEPARPLGSGALLAHYELIREIGRGVGGQVWLARDQRLDRNVALKLLPEQFTQNAERMRSFRHEAQAASALKHPNIIVLHDLSVANGCHYIATEYIPGQPLRRLIGQAYLTVRKAVEIAGQISSALISTHHIGILHRDIKPENV